MAPPSVGAMRFLVIEDDRETREYIVHGLVESGHVVDSAADGKDGLFLALENDYDSIVLDRMLPEIDGLTVLQTLRSADRTTPVLVLSALGEVVPTVEQYAGKLQADGMSADDPAYGARIKQYEQRLPMMNKQRLYPDFPDDFRVSCFYPMNKIRHPQANWFCEPFSVRSKLMSEHATSGIKFAGKVSQLITASTGFDDWEWGVTLWGRAPEYIKDIVYTMRFDEASARYAEFGPFYIGYIMPAADALDHLRI